MRISIPRLSLIVLIGPSGSGKSTFARKHFLPTEILSSDACRALVSDDENDQTVTNHAFEVLHFVAAKRLALGRLTVIDATNVQREARAPLLALAKEFHVVPVAIVLDMGVSTCLQHNGGRAGREHSARYVKHQHGDLRRSLGRRPQAALRREGFRYVYVFDTPAAAAAASFERQPLWPDRRHDRGPFDLIGDVHGCADELATLLERLGYTADGDGVPRHREGRRLVLQLGNNALRQLLADTRRLLDRGPVAECDRIGKILR